MYPEPEIRVRKRNGGLENGAAGLARSTTGVDTGGLGTRQLLLFYVVVVFVVFFLVMSLVCLFMPSHVGSLHECTVTYGNMDITHIQERQIVFSPR